jgi:hypothetical protein
VSNRDSRCLIPHLCFIAGQVISLTVRSRVSPPSAPASAPTSTSSTCVDLTRSGAEWSDCALSNNPNHPNSVFAPALKAFSPPVAPSLLAPADSFAAGWHDELDYVKILNHALSEDVRVVDAWPVRQQGGALSSSFSFLPA